MVRSRRWDPPVRTHGQGAQPHTEGVEVVEDPLMDILSKSIMDLSLDPGGRGGEGSGAPPVTNTRAAAGATGFAIGWAMGIGAFTMLACTGAVTTCIAGEAGANGAAMGGGGKGYGGGGTLNGMGVIMEGRGKFNCGGYGIGFIP